MIYESLTKIAILLTCYNRKETTLACLSRLFSQEGVSHIYQQDIYLVDDGSKDGTSVAVKAEFPEVNIIEGTGSLFWNGGMRLAWQAALASDIEYDFYLWVNDDSMLSNDSIARLLASYSALTVNNALVGAVVGTMIDPQTHMPTYGGYLSVSKYNPLSFSSVIQPSDEAQLCDAINGNFVLVPSLSVEKIGILSDAYTHGIGDNDYSFRLKKAGLFCWVAPGIYGECARNTVVGGAQDKTLSISERLKKMQLPNHLPPAKERLHFIREHGGFMWPVLWLRTWLRCKLPILWVLLK
jgi:GT2 family glycosyltransferase